MTCKAVCSCCRPSRESRVIYYAGSGGIDATSTGMTNQTFGMPQQQPGYVTIPISQIQASASSDGLTMVHTDKSNPGSHNGGTESNPPQYETVANEENFGYTQF